MSESGSSTVDETDSAVDASADEPGPDATDPSADEPGPDAGGATTTDRELHLASWTDRFLAWLVDVIIVGAVLSAFSQFVGVIGLFTAGVWVGAPFVGWNGVGLWAYWTYLEGSRGQSAGKMVMNIRVTDERGDDIDFETAAVESIGKALLLPIDCLVGWLAWDGEYVRLFNRLSNTIVIADAERNSTPEGVEYVKPGE